MAEVSQVVESSHYQVDSSELRIRVREFFLVYDESLTAELVG
jgi:hypothetical protein